MKPFPPLSERKPPFLKSTGCLLLLFSSLLSTSCQQSSQQELGDYIVIPHETRIEQWEIFGTPEWSDLAPGPSDYTTLIMRTQKAGMPHQAEMPTITLPINVTRPWMSASEKALAQALVTKPEHIPPSCFQAMVDLSAGGQAPALVCDQEASRLYFVALLTP